MYLMHVHAPGAQAYLWRSNKVVFIVFRQSVYIFEESQHQFRMLLEMCNVLASTGSTECKSPNGYVTIHDPFMFVESVEPRSLLQQREMRTVV